MLDIPNERSSHSIPTPRGGGLGIVVVAITILFFPTISGVPHSWVLLTASSCIATISLVDDTDSLPPMWRLLVHMLAATLLVWGFQAHGFWVTWPGKILGVLGLVWLTNLYNFMDGIDGIASVQAITTFGGFALIQFICSPSSPWTDWSLILLSTSIGFLIWNFPPARIFMGDCGSAFLGFTIAAIAWGSCYQDSNNLVAILILMAVFITDATLTLLRRLMNGEKVYLAHRSHAYQLAALRYQSHLKVILVVATINVLWLIPLALLVKLRILPSFVGIVIAYSPLIGLMGWFRPPRI